jgi:serine/threonine-protein kinase
VALDHEPAPSVTTHEPTTLERPSRGVDAVSHEVERGHREVLAQEEAARAAAFGRAATILCAIGVVISAVRTIPMLDRLAIMGASGLLGITSALVWWSAATANGYTRGMFRLFGLAATLCSLVLVQAIGVFSPIPVILVLGLSFFVHGRDTRVIFPVAIALVAIYFVSGLLVTLRVFPDHGVWRSPGTEEYASMTVVVTAVMITQLVLARTNHHTLHAAIAKSQEIMRVVRTREEQLDEARENLDAALRAGDGRLTGTQLGRWQVGGIVGRGAMGEVYSVRDPASDRTAAVKVLRVSDDTLLKRRFAREAEIARSMRGPNLVDVLETGETADGAPFIVMELLSGQDLGAILRDQTSLPLSEVVELVDQVAAGLRVLHDAGVVHRDLKPQNIFRSFGRPPVWKILDYGVSKVGGTGTMTENQLVGTPGYMSPEQAEGKEVDARSDVFSLGAVAYRAVTGRRPFSGTDTPQILYQIVHASPIKPRELVPSLPKEVETVLAVALAKRPAERFASASDLAEALSAAAHGGPRSVPHLQGAQVAAAWRAEPITLTLPRAERSGKRDPFPRIEEPKTTTRS